MAQATGVYVEMQLLTVHPHTRTTESKTVYRAFTALPERLHVIVHEDDAYRIKVVIWKPNPQKQFLMEPLVVAEREVL